ncbi:MAG: PQQ-binding-like beta-propeller repeat protein [Candidatus Hydrogenedentes bacterium]|nr:PQQ-binding-like beta-propeller repeat protein [Candidatus Hydrogenedentota bacterium]
MNDCRSLICTGAVISLAMFFHGTRLASADDRPQWGERFSRNMVSSESGLPSSFDLETGANVKWSAPLGGNAYGSPVIAGGKVLIGGNNEAPRDTRNTADCAVLLCLNEADGSLVWQLASPRIGGDNYLDWPMIGMCSAATVEGNRAYIMTNRFEIVCLDMDGQANGNDGPFLDEGKHMVPAGTEPLEVTATDADIIWLVDLPTAVGMYPHDGAHSSILIDGDKLYLNSGNGVDNTHKVIRKPDAPSLVVLDKASGKVLARDGEHLGPLTFHATWSPPALGEVNGKRLIIFGGPDGVCYAFDALQQGVAPAELKTLNRVWKFDCDPTAPKENVANYLSNRKESPSVIESMPVILNGRVYVTVGGDIWWGKEQSWLKCIDASKTGDITSTGEIWSYPMSIFCCSTPAVSNGLVFIGDCDGVVHCVDAETGQACWTHKLGGDIWGSPLVADGKVYIGSRNKKMCILSATRELQVLATVELPAPTASTPAAANGVLYVNTLNMLYAIKSEG